MKTTKSYLLMVEDDLNFADWAQAELGRDCADLTLVMCHDLHSARGWLATEQAQHLALAVVDFKSSPLEAAPTNWLAVPPEMPT